MRVVRLLFVALVAGLSGTGCVAYQIRDELRTTNQQLAQINAQMKSMAADMHEVDGTVRKTDSNIEKSTRSLHVVETSMEPIRISLRRIDDELAAFREVIDKLDEYLPVDIKPDMPPPARQAPTHETTPQK